MLWSELSSEIVIQSPSTPWFLVCHPWRLHRKRNHRHVWRWTGLHVHWLPVLVLRSSKNVKVLTTDTLLRSCHSPVTIPWRPHDMLDDIDGKIWYYWRFSFQTYSLQGVFRDRFQESCNTDTDDVTVTTSGDTVSVVEGESGGRVCSYPTTTTTDREDGRRGNLESGLSKPRMMKELKLTDKYLHKLPRGTVWGSGRRHGGVSTSNCESFGEVEIYSFPIWPPIKPQMHSILYTIREKNMFPEVYFKLNQIESLDTSDVVWGTDVCVPVELFTFRGWWDPRGTVCVYVCLILWVCRLSLDRTKVEWWKTGHRSRCKCNWM